MRILIRVLLALLALAWFVAPGMGLIDLSVTWDEDWPVMLEAGWGLLCTVGLGIPTLIAAARPGHASAVSVQLYVVTAMLLVGVLLGREPQAWWFFVLLAVELVLLRVLGTESSPGAAGRDNALLALAALGAPGWLPYAWWCFDQNRQSRFDADITMGTDHDAIQGALALALVALPLTAAIVGTGRRLLGTTTAMTAGYLGLLSLSWPDAVAGFDLGWSVAALAWGVLVGLTTWRPARRVARVEARAGTS